MIEIIPNLHPIFVHYTVALITTSAFCYFMGYVFCEKKIGKELLTVGRWCLWLGSLAAIATVSMGFVAYYSVVHDMPSHFAMTTHRNWALVTLAVVLFLAIFSLRTYFKNKPIKHVFLFMLAVASILIMITAWFGAEVVYRYGIGVQSLPKPMGVGHQHMSDGDDDRDGHGEHDH